MLLVATLTCLFILFVTFLVFVTRMLLSRTKISGLSERYVFVTGCDTGFGNLLTRSLDGLGVRVIAGCLTERGAQELSTVTSSNVKTVIVDITSKEAVKNAFEFTKTVVGETGLWGLVNNAGVMPTFAPAEWTSVEEFESVCKVNLFGTISVTLTFLPLLRRSQGRLVNVCSVTSNVAFPGIANYVISKSGVKMFTGCLRRELLNSGVTAHTIEPGGFQTQITEKTRLQQILKKAYMRASPETQEFYGGNVCSYLFNGMKINERYLSDKPQKVADAMVHALLAKYPKRRYLVGIDANLLFRLFTVLPEWLVDLTIGWPAPYGKLSSELEDSGIKAD